MMKVVFPAAFSYRSEIVKDIRRGLCLGVAVLAILIPSATSISVSPWAQVAVAHFADFSIGGGAGASPETRYIANWVADSRDNGGVGFVIVDKKFARVYIFDAMARLRSASPVLLGSARGDDSVPDIGSRPIKEVRPEERTTPAGRFVAERGRNSLGEDVVWIDYDAAVSMHRVRTTNPEERRLERLATPMIDDKRISYGCVNVPFAFYETYIRPLFSTQRAVVYVLPEFKAVQQVFRSYDVAAAHGLAPGQLMDAPCTGCLARLENRR